MIKGFDLDHSHSEHSQLEDSSPCQSLPNQCFHGIFSPEFLNSNLRKLDQYYQQKLTLEELDERHFINTDTRLQTPMKFSPFARKGPSHLYMP